tara:strand:- start:430 stop:1758 length:1329 start_codon:yes stop_codon:yes gene_type:complete
MAGSTYLTRSISSTSNRKKWTWSGWLKKTTLDRSYIFSSTNWGSGSDKYSTFFFENTGEIRYYDYTSTYLSQIKTNRKFRDINAWYHIVLTYDTAQSTSSDRIKLYVNSVQETSFSTASYPSQDNDSFVNLSGVPLYLGRESGTGSLFDGIMSHVHFCDGYAYAPSDFGSTDATTGEWKIKTSPSVSYGTNGYFLFKDNASVNDQSGNGNNFTLTAGTLTKTEDCPSNVFATLNPLDKGSDVNTTINGNTGATWNGVNGHTIRSTLAVSSGKYYWELNNANNLTVGIVSTEEPIIPTSGNLFPGGSGFGTSSYSYNLQDGKKGNNNTFSSYGSAITTSDILGCALDLDNGKIFWSKNGVWQGSGDPANGTNPAFSSISSDKTWSPAYGYVGTGANTLNVNYGNGYFGTTAVSSAGTNASGIGIFEYDVPTGYTALCTKGLNE